MGVEHDQGAVRWIPLSSAVVAVRIAVTASDIAGRPSAALARERYVR